MTSKWQLWQIDRLFRVLYDNAISAANNYIECNKRIKAIILSQNRSNGLQYRNRRPSSAKKENSRGAYVWFYEEVGRVIYRQYSLVMWVLTIPETTTSTCVAKWLSLRSGWVVKSSWIFSLKIQAHKVLADHVGCRWFLASRAYRKWNKWMC